MCELSPTTLLFELFLLEQRLEKLTREVKDFNTENPQAFTQRTTTYSVPPGALASISRDFSEKIGAFATQAIAIQQKTIQILTGLQQVAVDPGKGNLAL